MGGEGDGDSDGDGDGDGIGDAAPLLRMLVVVGTVSVMLVVV
jgi:hypothetical protein